MFLFIFLESYLYMKNNFCGDNISPDCKVQALWAPCGTNHNGQIGNLSQRVKRGVFTKSIPEETRTITVPSLSGL